MKNQHIRVRFKVLTADRDQPTPNYQLRHPTTVTTLLAYEQALLISAATQAFILLEKVQEGELGETSARGLALNPLQTPYSLTLSLGINFFRG